MQCKILIKPYFSDKFDNIRYNVKYQLSFVLKLVSFYFCQILFLCTDQKDDFLPHESDDVVSKQIF